jgi:hypothetical protein
MKQMDWAEDLCSHKNEEIKAANLAAVWNYARGLASTVRCYEAQVER